MNIVKYNTRITQKHATQAEWDMATDFVPLQGELIIYEDINKFKIGDGITLVQKLPFHSGDWNDLINKPFGEEEIHIVVNFNEIDQSINVPFGEDATFVKISDQLLTTEDFMRASVTLTANDGSKNIQNFDETNILFPSEEFLWLSTGAESLNLGIFYKDGEIDAQYGSIRFEFPNVPSTGIYVLNTIFSDYISIEIDTTAINKIDEKFLPDLNIEVVQSDWNQTDETKNDYIKNKPTVVTSINSTIPDETGNINIDTSVITDTTLSQEGSAADAKATGERIDEIEAQLVSYPIVEGTTNIQPKTYYTFGEVDELTINLVDADNPDRTSEYCFEFIPSEAFTGLNITPAPKWAHAIRYMPGTTCQVSILRGIGVMLSA